MKWPALIVKVLDLKHMRCISASHPRAGDIPNKQPLCAESQQPRSPPVPMESSVPGCGCACAWSRRQALTGMPRHQRFLIFHLTLFRHGPFEPRTPCNLCSSSPASFPIQTRLTARHQKLIFPISESSSLSLCPRSDWSSSRGDERTKQSKETRAGVEGYSSRPPVRLALLGCPRMNYQVLSSQSSTSPKWGYGAASLSWGGSTVGQWFIPGKNFPSVLMQSDHTDSTYTWWGHRGDASHWLGSSYATRLPCTKNLLNWLKTWVQDDAILFGLIFQQFPERSPLKCFCAQIQPSLLHFSLPQQAPGAAVGVGVDLCRHGCLPPGRRPTGSSPHGQEKGFGGLVGSPSPLAHPHPSRVLLCFSLWGSLYFPSPQQGMQVYIIYN